MNNDMCDLGGRIALVTGAGRGVGRRTALHLAAHGAGGVAVNDADPGRAAAVAEEITATGVPAVAAAADVGDFDAVGAMFDKVRADLGPVGILVNNAGNRGVAARPKTRPRPFWEQTPDDWAPWIHVNLDGVLNCTRGALSHMVPEGYGRIVTVISDAGRVGEAHGLEIYSAAKAGAAGFTRAVARLGGRHGVTANSVALGATRTPAIQKLTENEDFAKKALANYVVRRFGEPEDAANMILFLTSDAASWITGQTMPVNGGYSMTL
ncbi:SDR family NAD(P)-dependent oxidoreductase [Actinomadura sp. 9N407]|uniref:SDR family NAD(P)-dependent oxidoreductase n=1 Tax=Actinomadura sp. 9N407 TaxID=3375154 RepID=UPI0037BD4C3A